MGRLAARSGSCCGQRNFMELYERGNSMATSPLGCTASAADPREARVRGTATGFNKVEASVSIMVTPCQFNHKSVRIALAWFRYVILFRSWKAFILKTGATFPNQKCAVML